MENNVKACGSVLVVIPAYNEELNIGSTIDEIKKEAPSFDILVVDDCSFDKTKEIAAGKGVLVLSLSCRLGIAGARQVGYWYAHDKDYDFCLQMDADGQHDPSCVEKLLSTVREGKADFSIGSRFLNKHNCHTRFLRRMGIRIISQAIYFLARKRITDPTSGFRAANRRVINLFNDFYPFEYPEPQEIIILFRFGMVISEVPVPARERRQGRSFVTPIVSVYYMVEVILSLIVSFLEKYRVIDRGREGRRDV